VLPMALTGIRVVDLTELLPGPFCTMLLADYGAEVIKVERPGGDPARHTEPLVNGVSMRFAFVNRNKRSVVLNLKGPTGKEAFLDLVRSADILVEGYRPGVTERLGIDYARLREINPRLVYCSISGFGQESPHRLVAGHDMNYLSMAGTLDMTGTPETPVIPGTQIADLAGGSLQALSGILLTLMARGQTGEGQHVDISMMDGAFALQIEAMSYESAGLSPTRGTTRLTGMFPCYRIYRTGDGRFMALGALEEKFWQTFCKVVGRPDLVPVQFAEGQEAEAAIAEVSRLFANRSQAEWIDTFSGVDACCTPVRNAAEAMADPHVTVRELLVDHDHPVAGRLQQLGFPIRLTGTPGRIRHASPDLDADSATELGGLGYTEADLARIRAEAGGVS